MNGEGINYRLPEGAVINTVQCRAITKRRGLDRRCLHRTQRGVYCHQHLKQKRGLRITESETGEYGDQGQLGVFTTKPIKKGAIICDFTGKTVVDENFENPLGLWVKTRPATFIDASKTTENGEGRFVQDGGDENNAEFRYDAKGKVGYIKALRDINAGEEILADKNNGGKVNFIVPANIAVTKPRNRKLVRPLSVSDAYADKPEPEPVREIPPPPKTAVPRPAAPPRPVAPQPRPGPKPVIPERKLTIKEKRFRLWLLAMQRLYQDAEFAKKHKVKPKTIKVPVPAYDPSKSVLYNEQTMQAAAWDALKPFAKWLKIPEKNAEDIVKDYVKRKKLQL